MSKLKYNNRVGPLHNHGHSYTTGNIAMENFTHVQILTCEENGDKESLFSGVTVVVSSSLNTQEYSENENSSSESEESFKEITTSKEESSWCSSDEEDTEALQLALEAGRQLILVTLRISPVFLIILH